MSDAPGWSLPPSGIFPDSVFESLHQSDGDKARAILAAEALNPDGTLSPKATASSTAGEWDVNVVVSLVCLDADDDDWCSGRIGNDGLRFCGKVGGECNTKAHLKNPASVSSGWYITAPVVGSGLFLSPSLPLERDGGPITARAAAFALGGACKLSVGMWKLLFESWRMKHLRVEIPVSPAPGMPTGTSLSSFDFLEAKSSDDSPYPTSAPPVRELEIVEEAPTGGPLLSPTGDVRFARLKELFEGRLLAMDRLVGAACASFDSRLEAAEMNFAATMDAGEQRVAVLEAQCVDLRQRLEASERNYYVLLRRVNTLEQAGAVAPGASAATLVGGLSARDGAKLAEDLGRVTFDLYNPQGVVPLLQVQFTTFRDRIESGGGIECHGVKFASKKDCLAWVETHNIKHPAIFLDALAILHAIRLPYKDSADVMKEVETQEKIGYTSALEMAMKNSFSYPLPPVLIGGRRHPEGGSAYDLLLGYLKTYSVWSPELGPTGVANQVEEGVETVQGRWQSYLDSVTNNPTVSLLTAGLVMDSIKFCHDLVRFVNDQNRELTKGTSYTAAQVWAMQVECVSAILGEISAVREVEADAGKQNPGCYIWGMLRAWEIQQRYRKNKLKDDPMLTGILVRRIVMNGGDNGMVAKLLKYDELAKTVDANHRSLMGEIRKLREQIQKGGK